MLAFLQAPNNPIMTLFPKIDLFCEIGMCTKRSGWIFVKKLFIDNLKKVPQPILVQLYNMFEMLISVLIEKN